MKNENTQIKIKESIIEKMTDILKRLTNKAKIKHALIQYIYLPDSITRSVVDRAKTIYKNIDVVQADAAKARDAAAKTSDYAKANVAGANTNLSITFTIYYLLKKYLYRGNESAKLDYRLNIKKEIVKDEGTYMKTFIIDTGIGIQESPNIRDNTRGGGNRPKIRTRKIRTRKIRTRKRTP